MAQTRARGVYEKEPGSGIWWVRWTDGNSKLHREKVGRKSDAIALYQSRKADTRAGKQLPSHLGSNKTTFDDLAALANRHSEHANGKGQTKDLRERYRILSPYIGNKVAASIKPADIADIPDRMATERKWSTATTNRYLAAMSLAFRIGIEAEKVNSNPVTRLPRKREDNARIRYLSNDEESRLVAVIQKKWPNRMPDLMLSLHTGLRASEQYSLDWRDIDTERKLLRVQKSKNGHSRHIPLNDVALSALATLKARNPIGLVFGTSFTGHLVKPNSWFRLALRDAKVDGYTWHCNRHTFASRLVMAGVDIRTVAELMGHQSIQMTMRYSHLGPEHNAAAVARLIPTGTVTDTSKNSSKKVSVSC